MMRKILAEAMTTAAALAIAISAVWSSPAEASGFVTNDALEHACSQRTIVTGWDEGKKLTTIGDSIDGFCAGFIRATIESFSPNRKCSVAGENLDFLLSVYSHYLKTNTIPSEASALSTLRIAFARIPDCSPLPSESGQKTGAG